MELNFIGIGGAFNTKLGNNCAYVKEDNKILFIDIGLDTLEKVVKYKLLDNIKEVYVLITHLHGDHVGGLPTFIQYVYYNYGITTKIVSNSESFVTNLKILLTITAVKNEKHEYINVEELPFSFKVDLKMTSHIHLLECYSVIFSDEKGKTLYTSDSNDIEYLKAKIEDEQFTKIYTEVGENSPVHIEYEQLKKIDKNKLELMHIQSMELYNKLKKEVYKVPSYLK